MDVVSHALFGRLLGRLDAGGTLGPGSRSAFVLGALAPDLDAVFVASGWDRYLVVHEAGLHTLAASPAVALAVALSVRAVVKRAELRRLWCAAWLSVVLGHVLFDLVSGSDIRLLAPVDQMRLGPHYLAMADLLAVIVLLTGSVASRWRPRAAALLTCAALTLLVSFKAYTRGRAVAAFHNSDTTDSVGTSVVSIEAVNGSLFEWAIYQRSGRTVRAWRVDARSGRRELRFERRVEDEAETLSARIEVPAIANFRRLGRVPFPRIEYDGGQRLLLWSDVRDCEPASCVMSFGAEVDDQGRPTIQVIRVGPFEQRRRLPTADGSY